MDAAVPILSYTDLPPGAGIGIERTADGCTFRFRRVCPWPRPAPLHAPTWSDLAWSLLVLVSTGALVVLVQVAFDVPLREAVRFFAKLLAGASAVVAFMTGLLVLRDAYWRDPTPRVRLTITRTQLTLHARRADLSLISYRVGRIARVDAINGRLSIRLIDGRGWLDGEGVGSFYFDTDIRRDELTWLVRTLRQELGLAARSSVAAPRIMPHDVPGERP
jgi:hypothetical protein